MGATNTCLYLQLTELAENVKLGNQQQSAYTPTMAIIRKTKSEDYIVVHHVYGEHEVIDFLRMTSHTVVNRLFTEAKLQGISEFRYRNMPYRISWTERDLYLIESVEEASAGVT